MLPDPDVAAQQRLALAGQPALGIFAFFVAAQLTVASALQLASLPFGLVFAEVFVFALPVVLWVRGANWRVRPFLKLAAPPKGLLGLGFVAGVANFLVAGALQGLIRAALPSDWTRPFDSARVFEGLGGADLGVLLVALGAFAPLCEELAFRGYLQTVLRARHSDLLGVVLTAVLFSVLHLDPVGMIARVELGVVFGLLVLWSGSLWPAVAAHAANNLCVAAVVLVALSKGPLPTGPQSGELTQSLLLGLAGLAMLLALLRAARRTSLAASAADPPLEAIAPEEGHFFRLARVRRPAALAALGALAFAASFLGLGWTKAQVNLADATVPLGELKRRLPDDAARRQFTERLASERRRALEGELDLETYRATRQRLAALPKGRAKDAPIPLAEVERALEGAPPPPPGP